MPKDNSPASNVAPDGRLPRDRLASIDDHWTSRTLMRGPLLVLAGGCAAALALLPACGGDGAGPSSADLRIVKPETDSGDEQVGVAGAPLGHDLRVIVTRGGVPVARVPVAWSTTEGSLTPASGITDSRGISTARWTLQHLFAQQVASARLDPDGPPAVV